MACKAINLDNGLLSAVILYKVINNLYLQDPEFYDFLKEHDQELLQFDDEDIEVSMQELV